MSGASAPAAVTAIHKRHVIYVHGYDPRGENTYGRLLREQYLAYCALHGLKGRSVQEGGACTPHVFFTQHASGEVQTVFEHYGWEDCVRPDFERPFLLTLSKACGVLVTGIFDGSQRALFRASRRFHAFLTYPFVLFFLLLALALVVGTGAGFAAEGFSNSVSMAVVAGFLAAGCVLFTLVQCLERKTYMKYLFSFIVATDRYARGLQPTWQQAFHQFAQAFVTTVQETDADEIVVIGHSLGASVAVDILTRAAELDPQFAGRGTRVVFCSLGSCLPYPALHPRAHALRQRVSRITEIPGLEWIDVQARKDVINFCPFDPIGDLGLVLSAEGRRPTILEVRFRDLILPENYPSFRLHFFNIHFQFIKANQRLGAAYDYFHWCCGCRPFGSDVRGDL